MITLSSTPGDRLPEIQMWNWDKFAHLFEYAVFAFLLLRFMVLRNPASARYAWIVCIVICAVYGALDELHQLFISLRSCDWRDWVADFAGACIGIAVDRGLGAAARMQRRRAGA